jgi:hypothetical protein
MTKDSIPTSALPRNTHRVQRGQWRKWNVKARETFNWLFGLMTKQPDLFTHPKAPKQRPEHRKTTAWNAAWLAADAVKDATTPKRRSA